MKKLLLVAFLSASATCQQREAVEAESPIQEINARIVGDQLPVDGCEAHLVLDFASASADWQTSSRLPTAATRPLLENSIKAEIARQPAGTLWMGTKSVAIRYRETRQTAILTCGWGNRQKVKVIELLAVSDR